MDFRHIPDGSVGDPFFDEPGTFTGMPLVPHLRDDPCFPGGLCQRAGLMDRVRERLLHEDMLPHFHRHHRDRCVRVVRCADGDGVYPLFLLEHHTEVPVPRRLEELRSFHAVLPERFGDLVVIHIAERDDVLRAHCLNVGLTLPVDPHAGNVQLVARWRISGSADHVTGNDGEGGGSRCCLKERSPRNVVLLDHALSVFLYGGVRGCLMCGKDVQH